MLLSYKHVVLGLLLKKIVGGTLRVFKKTNKYKEKPTKTWGLYK